MTAKFNTNNAWFDHASNMTDEEHQEHMEMRRQMFDSFCENITKNPIPVVIENGKITVGTHKDGYETIMFTDGQFESNEDIWGDDDLPY